MSGTAGLTDGSMTPGVYRVLDAVGTVTDALTAGGWSTALAAPAQRTADLYAGLATALQLPDWFGSNLDALWDALTDLPRPTALIMVDWTRYAQARPERWSMILDLFEQRCTVAPPFAVVLVQGESWNSD